jgi:Zn-dependent protease
MKGSLHLGSPFGIGLFVHWTFGLLIAFLLFLTNAGLGGLIFVLALFGCVTLHEYGHALAARRYGIPTHSITLYPIGGVARLASLPQNPKQELVIALAGPAVNVAIAIVASGLALIVGAAPVFALPGISPGAFLWQLVTANVILVIFNMIPAFPMDGGRVLRAVLAFSGNYVWATHIAARTGQFFAVLFGLAGISGIGSPFLVFIGVMIFLAAGAERRMAILQEQVNRPGGFASPPRPRPPGNSFTTSPPPVPSQPPGGSMGVEDAEWEVLPPDPRTARKPATSGDPTNGSNEALLRDLERIQDLFGAARRR